MGVALREALKVGRIDYRGSWGKDRWEEVHLSKVAGIDWGYSASNSNQGPLYYLDWKHWGSNQN